MASTTTKVDKFGRGVSTMAVQLVFFTVTWLVVLGVTLAPYTGEEGPPDTLSCVLFIGGLYALAGAVIQVLAHNRSGAADDYWGKQLVLGGASNALIGATFSVPAFLFVATFSALVLAGFVVPVLVLSARWLRYRPEACRDDTVW